MLDSFPHPLSPRTKASQLLRTFVALNEIKPLVKVGSAEWFHETGMMPEIEAYLAAAVDAPGTSPEDRFWALDSLVFGNFKRGDPQIGRRLDVMSRLVAEYNLGADEKLSLGMKRMNFAAGAKDAEGVRSAMKETAAHLPDNPKHQRIARYNYARAMFELGIFDGCAAEVKSVMVFF